MRLVRLFIVAVTVLGSVTLSSASGIASDIALQDDVTAAYPAPWDVDLAIYALQLQDSATPDALPTTFDGFSCYTLVTIHSLGADIARALDVTWCHNEASGLVTAMGDVMDVSDGWTAISGRCGWGSDTPDDAIACTWTYANLEQEGQPIAHESLVLSADGSVSQGDETTLEHRYDCDRERWIQG